MKLMKMDERGCRDLQTEVEKFDTDGAVLMPQKRNITAEDFFRTCDAAGLSDFALDRSDNVILQPKG